MDNSGSTNQDKKDQLINTENFRYPIYHMTYDI